MACSLPAPSPAAAAQTWPGRHHVCARAALRRAALCQWRGRQEGSLGVPLDEQLDLSLMVVVSGADEVVEADAHRLHHAAERRRVLVCQLLRRDAQLARRLLHLPAQRDDVRRRTRYRISGEPVRELSAQARPVLRWASWEHANFGAQRRCIAGYIPGAGPGSGAEPTEGNGWLQRRRVGRAVGTDLQAMLICSCQEKHITPTAAVKTRMDVRHS